MRWVITNVLLKKLNALLNSYFMHYNLTGVPGFEPGMAGSKPAALPLGYTPSTVKQNDDTGGEI